MLAQQKKDTKQAQAFAQQRLAEEMFGMKRNEHGRVGDNEHEVVGEEEQLYSDSLMHDVNDLEVETLIMGNVKEHMNVVGEADLVATDRVSVSGSLQPSITNLQPAIQPLTIITTSSVHNKPALNTMTIAHPDKRLTHPLKKRLLKATDSDNNNNSDHRQCADCVKKDDHILILEARNSRQQEEIVILKKRLRQQSEQGITILHHIVGDKYLLYCLGQF